MPNGWEARAGELAALTTAMLWGGSAMFFGAAARRRGVPLLNFIRIALACFFLGTTVLLTGTALKAPPAQAAFLCASGIVGLALGDAAYFRCLRILGPRRAALTMSFAPAMTALLMVPLLGETIGLPGIAGMVVTLAGILWVHNERDHAREIEGSAGMGFLMGLLGAAGQAGGVVLAKVGLGAAPMDSWLASTAHLAARTTESGAVLAGVAVTPLYGTLLRMVAALACLVVVLSLGRRGGWSREALADRRFLAMTAGGTVTGPFLGVWLSLVAVSLTNTAVAATIMASSPIFVIMLVRVVYRQRVSMRAWCGAAVAVVGVALLTFRDVLRP